MGTAVAVLGLIGMIFYAGVMFCKGRIIRNLEELRVLTPQQLVKVMKIWT